jgi:cell division transport system permease protein
MFTNFKRIFSFSINDFSRNKGISIAAIFVLVIAILILTGLFFFQGITQYLTDEIQNKIDITAYFQDGTSEQDILNVRNQILKLTQNIKNVEYVSKDQALIAFNDKYKDNPVLSKALQEVGDNPFLPSLNITTNGEPAQYEQVSKVLQNSDFSKLIDKVDFSQKKDTIEKVYSITSNINKFGILLSVVLIIVSILVVFNTIKLAIDNSKDEIATMKIVGASDWFARGPFIISGAIYGFISFLICFIISGVLAYFLSAHTEILLPGFSLTDYFLTNWWIFVLIQLGFGVGVGVASSFVAVRKYLNI